MKLKLLEWMKRYLPAETFSILGTLLAAGMAYRLTGDQLTTALAGTWAGNFTYFGFIIITDITRTVKVGSVDGVPYTWKLLLGNLKPLMLEFGVAEIIDSFFIRPVLMYYLPILLSNLSLGIFLAKIAADVTFYIPVIVSYELSKRHLKSTR